MTAMFRATQSFRGDFSKWDVSSVQEMEFMFGYSAFNGDISEWNVSSVQNMEGMFHTSAFSGHISKWDVSRVQNMRSMFFATEFNGDISEWDVSRVQNMHAMFHNASFNGDISKWDVSSVQSMKFMFAYSAFSGDISKWDVASVQDMYGMFVRANSFNGDLSSWDVSAVTDMQLMFYGATSFNGMIKDWDVSSVTTFKSMFYDASSFSRNLCWNISHDADTSSMMEGTAGACWNCCDPSLAPTYSPDIGTAHVEWTYIGTGGSEECGWDNMGNASSLAEAKDLMLKNEKCAKEGGVLFYSIYSSSLSWGVRCSAPEMFTQACQNTDNPNWKQYQLSFEGSDFDVSTLVVYAILTDNNIRTAVNEWVGNESAATAVWGHISSWDVSRITDM